MAPIQETGDFEALTGDAESGVDFPADEPLRQRSAETDDVGGTAVGRPFNYDEPHESVGFGD